VDLDLLAHLIILLLLLGIVPNLAARAHQDNIFPVFDRALVESGLNFPRASEYPPIESPAMIVSDVVFDAALQRFFGALPAPSTTIPLDAIAVAAGPGCMYLAGCDVIISARTLALTTNFAPFITDYGGV
jgi:tRNA A37 threonylcarbamoyltransferase TsaD